MSVITAFVPAQSSGHTHLVTVKGAPEILKEMVKIVIKSLRLDESRLPPVLQHPR